MGSSVKCIKAGMFGLLWSEMVAWSEKVATDRNLLGKYFIQEFLNSHQVKGRRGDFYQCGGVKRNYSGIAKIRALQIAQATFT